MNVPEGLTLLTRNVVGEDPTYFGSSFNEHFTTPHSFIKMTRAWVKPERALTDVAAAWALHGRGFPVARPLVPEVLSFEDQDGHTRWVTFWERLTPTGETATVWDAARWAEKVWGETMPEAVDSCFQLDDFRHAAHVRLAHSPHPLAPRVLEELELMSTHRAYTSPFCGSFIHGDLHPANIVVTGDGPRLIDWESACRGPLEWDGAQTLRYASPEEAEALQAWWVSRGADEDLLTYYRRLRSLTSLSHLIATGDRPELYYRTLAFLGWD